MKRTRIILALLCAAVMLVAGCSRAGDAGNIPADSVITNGSPAAGTAAADSVPADSGVAAAAAESSAKPAIPARNVPVIYLIIPTETGLSAQEEDIILKGARRSGYDVIVKTHEGDPAKQTKAFEAAAANKAVAVICDNISGDSTVSDAAASREAGIPVFLMNRGTAEEGVCDGQVRTNRNSAIAQLAEVFARHNRLSETYALLFDANDSSENLYVSSFRGGLASFANMREAAEESLADLTPENVKNVVSRVLDANPSVGTLVCGDGDQALAVIDALAELGIEKEVICLDGDNDNLTISVLKGNVYATVVKPAQQLAEQVLGMVLTCLQTGERPAETAYAAGVLISNDEPESLEDINREIAVETAPTATPTPRPSYDDDDDYQYSYHNYDYDYDDYYDDYDDEDNDDDDGGGDDNGDEGGSSSSGDEGSDSGGDASGGDVNEETGGSGEGESTGNADEATGE